MYIQYVLWCALALRKSKIANVMNESNANFNNNQGGFSDL